MPDFGATARAAPAILGRRTTRMALKVPEYTADSMP